MKYWMIVAFGFVYVLCNSFINITLRQRWSSFEQKSSFTGKVQNSGLIWEYINPVLSAVALFLRFFFLFQYFTLESCWLIQLNQCFPNDIMVSHKWGPIIAIPIFSIHEYHFKIQIFKILEKKLELLSLPFQLFMNL